MAVQAAAVAVVGWRMRHAAWRAVLQRRPVRLRARRRVRRRRCSPAARVSTPAAALDGRAPWSPAPLRLVRGQLRPGRRSRVWLRFGGRWWPSVRHGAGVSSCCRTGSLLLLGPVLVAAAQVSAALIPLVLVAAVRRPPDGPALRRAGASSPALDPLTGLPNRKALLAEVAEQVAPARRARPPGASRRRHLALLLLDLDRFKHVNDALGHAVGDRLLVEVGAPADRRSVRPATSWPGSAATSSPSLAAAARPAPATARGAGRPGGRRARRAGRARRAAARRRRLDRHRALPRARRRTSPPCCATPTSRCTTPSTAATTVAVYAPESDHNSPERLSLLGRPAPRRCEARPRSGDGIALYYQPQVAIATGEVVGRRGAAALAAPASAGMVDPEELIRVAEQSAVMRLLTRRVVDDVVEQLAKWRGRPAITCGPRSTSASATCTPARSPTRSPTRLRPVRGRRRTGSSWRSPRAR